MVFTFISCSTSGVNVLLNENKSVSYEYALENDKIIKEKAMLATKEIQKDLASKFRPKFPEIPGAEGIDFNDEFKYVIDKMFTALNKGMEYKIENISYLSKDRVDVKFNVKSVDIFSLFKEMQENPEKYMKEMLPRILNDKTVIEMFLKSDLPEKEKAKYMFRKIMDSFIVIIDETVEEKIKQKDYIYSSQYISLIKENGQWKVIDLIRTEASKEKYSVLLNNKYQFSREKINELETEIFKLPILEIQRKNSEKLLTENFKIPMNSVEYLNNLMDEMKYTKKAIHFIDEKNIEIKYEIKLIDILTILNHVYFNTDFLQEMSKISDINERTKYILQKLYSKEMIDKMKKENKYIYQDNYLHLEKINGKWEVRDTIRKQK